MEVLNKAAIVVCLFVASSAVAQKSKDTATHFTPPVIEKDKDSLQKSENKKEEYKSKEWHQGIEVPDTANSSIPHPNSGMKKSKKRVPPPPPPPLPPLKD